jgi:hypothetical protein
VPAETLWDIPVVVHPEAPKDTGFVIGDNQFIVMHPVAYLRCQYPMSPVWCERTAGHREARRDQRR